MQRRGSGCCYGWLALLIFCGATGVVVAQSNRSATDAGQSLYGQHCASCHDHGVARAPSRQEIREMSAASIEDALTTGRMSAQAAGLSAEQIKALSEFLSRPAEGPQTTAAEFTCRAGAPAFAPRADEPHWNGWGVDLAQSRFQPAAMAQLSASEVPRLKLKWAFGFVDATQAYAQPAVIGGRIFVGSAGRRVYSLDAKTGCSYWTIRTEAAVRTAISAGHARSWAIYFGDQHANAYGVDAATGAILWKTRVDDYRDAQITGSPALYDGRLYVPVSSLDEVTGADAKDECCKFRGSLSALDAATGKILWKTFTIAEEPRPAGRNRQGVQLWGPSGAGIWSSPTIDPKNHMVYVTTGDDYSDPATITSDSFMAIDMDTGKVGWSRQITKDDAYNVDCDLPAEERVNCPASKGPDFDFGSSAILVTLANGRRALIAGQKSGIVSAVDPDHQGALLWQRRVGHGGTLGGVQWGSAADSNKVYVAVSDVVRRAAPPGSAAGQASVFGVPYELDPKTGGGILALWLDTGEVAWHTPHPGCEKPGCSPAQSAAVTAIPGIVFSGGVDGHLRAYSATDGHIVWDVDTQREYKTVNGVKAHGGSIDGPGAVVAGGTLYINSGYFFQGSVAGNVLLAFSVDGK
jgi:polyvinyl alcohol dehydrogenase (cytochrome)